MPLQLERTPIVQEKHKNIKEPVKETANDLHQMVMVLSKMAEYVSKQPKIKHLTDNFDHIISELIKMELAGSEKEDAKLLDKEQRAEIEKLKEEALKEQIMKDISKPPVPEVIEEVIDMNRMYPPGSEMARRQKELKSKMTQKLESKMEIKDLIALADKFDSLGEEVLANQIDALIQKLASEQPKSDETKQEIPVKKAVETKEPDAFEKLAGIADKLDAIGAKEEANLIDSFLSENAKLIKDAKKIDKKPTDPYDWKQHHSEQIREPKKDQERPDRQDRKEHHIKPYHAHGQTLSTRYCVDHIGVTMSRIAENTYQCPIDGQVYNWETGFTDAQGVKHPGSSVAKQTPDATDYQSSNRVFDSREKVLNVIN